MMFKGGRDYINFTHSTAYTIGSVVTAYTIVTIVYAVLCVKLVYSLQPLMVVKNYCNYAKHHSKLSCRFYVNRRSYSIC